MGVQGLDPASPVSWDQAHAPRSPVPRWAECFNKPHLPGAPHSLDPSCLNEFFLWPLNSWPVSGLSLLHWLRLLSFLKNILLFFKRLYWICYSIIIFMFFYFCPQVMCNLSSLTWDLTHNPCIGSCSHWTTREASDFCLLLLISAGPTSTPISGFFALHFFFFFLFYNPLATIFFNSAGCKCWHSSYKMVGLDSREPWLEVEKDEENSACHLNSKTYMLWTWFEG